MIQIEDLKAVLSEIGFVKESIGDYFQKITAHALLPWTLTTRK